MEPPQNIVCEVSDRGPTCEEAVWPILRLSDPTISPSS